MKNLILIAVLMLSIQNSFASAVGEVKRLYVSGTVVRFQLEGDSCSSNSYYAFEASTEAGKLYYSLLLASAASKTPVSVRTPGHSCLPAEEEQVQYLVVDY